MPMLDFWPGQLMPTKRCDDEMRQLADRHYNRQTPGSAQFIPPGRTLVLRDAAGLIYWSWVWQDYRQDGQDGYNCCAFRNESPRLASEIILEAEQHAIARWGPGRMFTYINPDAVRSTNPGYCYLKAGWHKHGYSTERRRLLLVKYDGCLSSSPPRARIGAFAKGAGGMFTTHICSSARRRVLAGHEGS
jgi:hypothetical protein